MLYAVTVLGVTFSGREALVIGVVVIAILLIAWWVLRRR